jgi:hypothetical protein
MPSWKTRARRPRGLNQKREEAQALLVEIAELLGKAFQKQISVIDLYC